ncbi:xanthine dehydrogenase accessory protein XdhC [Limibaculum sp. FT325]|uniref:xanthine dehydrogenase accessory protein XdhC n=1 Tax=Thermohalobaculum sediminis TaxID=2939436 RepID=UPI0020C0F389|nr:xanthine dehydrogenase accessory protein XdhC [Limibaculum sediminis]MCL5777292.1 xanthine dehydrogenase accessory protein XdhC [Limibaculum sediminis]
MADMGRATLAAALREDGRGVLVLIASARGSTPREAGAAMLVTPSRTLGTIGGGAAEHRAIAAAREMLGQPPGARAEIALSLGPALDQCCGGRLSLALARLDAADAGRLDAPTPFVLWPGGPELAAPGRARQVVVYGAGHVGQALVAALSPLPFRLVWIETRPSTFPDPVPPGIETRLTPLPEAEAATADADAFHLVLTHSHAVDLEIVEAVLRRGEFGHLGLIGSTTKRATFARRLAEHGLPPAAIARLACPIGLPGLSDKRPAVIAASVAADLLLRDRAAALRLARGA